MAGRPRRVVNDELHVGKLTGDGDHVTWLIPGVLEVEKRQPLVAADDLDAQVARMLHDGQADGRVIKEEAVPARSPRRVDLERIDMASLSRSRHLIETGPQRADVRRQNLLLHQPDPPPPV